MWASGWQIFLFIMCRQGWVWRWLMFKCNSILNRSYSLLASTSERNEQNEYSIQDKMTTMKTRLIKYRKWDKIPNKKIAKNGRLCCVKTHKMEKGCFWISILDCLVTFFHFRWKRLNIIEWIECNFINCFEAVNFSVQHRKKKHNCRSFLAHEIFKWRKSLLRFTWFN